MSTTLYFTNGAANGLTDNVISPACPTYDLSTTVGTGAGDTGYKATAFGSTQVRQFGRSVGDTTFIEWVSGRSPSGGWTFAGSFTFHLWALQSALIANCRLRVNLYKVTAANSTGGSITGISANASNPFNMSGALGTTASDNNITNTPTSTAFAEDDLLLIRVYIIPTSGNNMQASQNCVLNYFGSNANSADSRVILTETVAFKAWSTGGAGVAAGTSTVAAVGRGAFDAVGAAAGTSTATAVGRSLFSAVGSSAGTSTATAVGAVYSAAGTAAGTSTAAAVGQSAGAMTGTAAGTSTATSVGSRAKIGDPVDVLAVSSVVANASRMVTAYWVVQTAPSSIWTPEIL